MSHQRLAQLLDLADYKEGGAVTLRGVEAVFNNIVFVALGLAGIVFFIMLISGGFKYLTSAGDPKMVESAGKTLTFAVLGLVFIVISFLILRFIQDFTGINVTEFKVFQEP